MKPETKKIILIAVGVVVVVIIAVGSIYSLFAYLTKPAKTPFLSGEGPLSDSEKSVIVEQYKNKTMAECVSAVDFGNIYKTLQGFQQRFFSLGPAIDGYLSCQAIKQKDPKVCNILADVSQNRPTTCMTGYFSIMLASTNCDAETKEACSKSGYLSSENCNLLCDIVSGKNCDIVTKNKNFDPASGPLCEALAKDSTDPCASSELSEESKKDCLDSYAALKSLKTGKAGTLQESNIRFADIQAALDGSFSCINSYTKKFENLCSVESEKAVQGLKKTMESR